MSSLFKLIYKFFRKTKNVILVIFYSCFSLSILSYYISPERFGYLPLFGLIFFPLFIFNIFIFVIYLKRNKWIAFPSLILILCSLMIFLNVVTWNNTSEKKGLKILSWNVKNFDLYNWTNNLKTRQMMMQAIDSTNADVLCLQEFFTNDFEYNNLKTIIDLGYTHYCFYPSYSQKNNNNQWGLAIFSKHPILERDLIDIHPEKSAMNQCVYAQIDVKGKRYNIYNAHFQSIHLGYQDYDYIKDVEHQFSMVDFKKSWSIFSKIKLAYLRRTSQVNTFVEHFKKEKKENVILCCDLNDVPNSFAYHQLSSQFNDAFLEKGRGLSNTIDLIFPMYRIDYFFASDEIEIYSYNRLKTKLSDHHMILSTIN